MLSLGLDPSLTGFGWCIHDSEEVGPERVVARGVWSTSPRTLWVERYVLLREQVAALLDEYRVSAVGVESPPFGETFSSGLYGLFLMVNEAVWRARRDVVYFDPATVKMLVKDDPKLRRGRMFKSDMVQAARADTGITRWNHNEADAYHIGRFAARFWALLAGQVSEENLTPSERHAFLRAHTFTRGKRQGQTVKSGAAFKENQRFFRFSLLPPDGAQAV